MNLLGGTLVGEAAKAIVKRVITGNQGDVELKRAQIELSMLEAQGTLEQRNWRPYTAVLLIKLVAIYMLMPILAEAVYMLTKVWMPNVPKFPWFDIWSATGLALMTLTTSFLGIYAGGRSWEKKQGASDGGVVDRLTEYVTGNRRKKMENRPQVSRDGRQISPIDRYIEPVKPVQFIRPIDGAQLAKEIEQEEKRVDAVYRDHLGNKTAGIGHLLRPDELEYGYPVGTVVKKSRVNEWFRQDIRQAVNDAKRVVPDFKRLPHEARLVFSNMAFQLGGAGLAEFKKTMSHVAAGEWKKASTEMLDSKWHKQTPNRARRLAARLARLEGTEFGVG